MKFGVITNSANVIFQVTPNPGTMFNIPNLIEDREYDFRVIAVNEAGESRPTECGRSVKVKDPKGQSKKPYRNKY